jgi:hypothetical protein
MRNCVFLIISFLFFFSCGKSEEKAVQKAFRNYAGNYVIVISKKKFSLFVYQRDKGLLESCKIGYGSSPASDRNFMKGITEHRKVFII